MPRRRRRRANWPYRIAWCAIIIAIALYIGLGTLIGGFTYGYRSFGIDWQIAFVTTAMSATIATWFVAVGASLGSFLNVVAYRLPLGRTVGGHSGCPYCCTPIQRGDNVPVLAWIKLRGRCRTCHLPISAQYPLVEFLVGMIFLVVFLSEFARSGANLPTDNAARQVPMYQAVVTGTLVMRLISYATILCGLVAAGLIEVKRQTVPLRLFAWSLLPLVVSAVVDPRVVVVLWRPLAALGPIESRLHGLLTLGLGALVGGLLAYLITLVMRARGAMQRPETRRTWIAGAIVVGALVGWQSVPLCLAVMLASWLIGSLLFRRFANQLLVNSTAVWMWLGVLVFRAAWRELLAFQLLPESLPELARYGAGVAALLAFSWFISAFKLQSSQESEAIASTPPRDPSPLNSPPLESTLPHTENDTEALT